MPFSEDQLDQMLSEFIDDVLESPARSSLEELMRNNPLLQARLDAMQAVQQSLKQLSKRDAHIRLDDSFADRVLNEAVSRAREEGLAAEHPLVRVAEQPMRAARESSWLWNRKTIASVAAVAASLGLILWASSTRPAPEPLASQPQRTSEQERPLAEPSPLGIANVGPSITDEHEILAMGSTPEMTASTPIDTSKGTAPEILIPMTSETASQVNLNSTPSSVVSVAPAARSRPTAVIVLDVRQSDHGRSHDAVRRALHAAEIPSSSKKPISGLIAKAATSAANLSADQRVSLMYLEASAKKLDGFYMAMLRDTEGIQSVSMSLAIDAPLIDAMEELRPEPNTVAASAGAMSMSGDDPSVADLVQQMDQLPFAPLSRDVATGMSQSDEASAPASVLVIIR